jgi:hypothetical protein
MSFCRASESSHEHAADLRRKNSIAAHKFDDDLPAGMRGLVAVLGLAQLYKADYIIQCRDSSAAQRRRLRMSFPLLRFPEANARTLGNVV